MKAAWGGINGATAQGNRMNEAVRSLRRERASPPAFRRVALIAIVAVCAALRRLSAPCRHTAQCSAAWCSLRAGTSSPPRSVIGRAIAVWQASASLVTMQPLRSGRSRRAGIAVIAWRVASVFPGPPREGARARTDPMHRRRTRSLNHRHGARRTVVPSLAFGLAPVAWRGLRPERGFSART